jgi:hypothetical protein
VRLWEDDLERDGGWTFDRAVWQVIPSGDIPVSWAHSGRRALYGYMPSAAAAGTTGSATMRRPITIPAGETHLAFHFNVPTYTGTAGGVAVEYNAGAGWQSVSPDTVEPLPAGTLTRGYVTYAYDVSGLAGRSAQFRFRLTRQANVDREWLVDDVRLYQCVAVPATPRNVTAEFSMAGTSATVSWDRPQAGTAVDHYEISVNPPVPGAPTTVAPGGDTTSLALAGLDATKGYIFKVWAVDAAGGRSLPAELRFSATPPVDCRSAGVRIVNGRPIPRCKTPS